MKPEVILLNEDGNIFSILGACSKALKRVGKKEQAKELSKKVFNAKDYYEALKICSEYVELV